MVDASMREGGYGPNLLPPDMAMSAVDSRAP